MNGPDADDENPAKRGRPRHEPTDHTRAVVVDLVGQDKTAAEIAEALRLSEPTLRAHYAEELAAPRPQLNFPFAEFPRPKRARNTDRMGRPHHVPTNRTRKRVEILVFGGMRQWQIAAALGISVPTLCEHYAVELDNGRSRKKADVLVALYTAATVGKNVAAQKACLALPESLEQAPTPAAAAGKRDDTPGKKEAARLAAHQAAIGTDWASLLPN